MQRIRVGALVALLLLLVPAGALGAGDPYRDQQWALDRIGTDEAWQVTRGEGIVVAVIDTGITLDHPDLAERFLRDGEGRVVGFDALDSNDPSDRHGHGTLVAGIIAANEGNGAGIAGVAPGVRLMPVRVLDEDGAGRGRDVDVGIRWAVDHGADVINLSLESVPAPDGSSRGPGAPTAAVRYAWERGVIVVAAAGNNGGHLNDYPADSPVILVGATDKDDQPAPFSDRVRGDVIFAPGVDIVSTWCRPAGADRCQPPSHTYGLAEGTSFAAPHVSGVLALLLATGLDHEDAVAQLRTTARPLTDDPTGPTIIDAGAAVAAASSRAASAGQERTAGAAAAPSPSPSPEPAPPPPPPAPEEVPPSPEPIADDTPEGTETPVPAEPSAVPVAAESAPTADPPPALALLAAALVGASLTMWTVVARRI